MTEKRRRLYILLLFGGGGAANFLIKVLFGEAPDVAAVNTVIYLALLGVLLRVLWRRRRKTLQRLSDQGQIECYLRRPEAPQGDRYRKWNIGLVTPAAGALMFQAVLGRTSIPRGDFFNTVLRPSPGAARYPASQWDKFNRLESNAIILPLEGGTSPPTARACRSSSERPAGTGSERSAPERSVRVSVTWSTPRRDTSDVTSTQESSV